MKAKHILNLIIFALIVTLFASCEYDFIKPEPAPPPPDPTDTIFFSLEVVPIFAANSCTNCHKPGGFSQLDLTAANAYNSLTSLGMVNTADPAASKIYTYPNPTTGTHGNKYANESEVQTILQWITQGAKNN
nr:hypothetical protein [Bacteroidota bacterium]